MLIANRPVLLLVALLTACDASAGIPAGDEVPLCVAIGDAVNVRLVDCGQAARAWKRCRDDRSYTDQEFATCIDRIDATACADLGGVDPAACVAP